MGLRFRFDGSDVCRQVTGPGPTGTYPWPSGKYVPSVPGFLPRQGLKPAFSLRCHVTDPLDDKPVCPSIATPIGAAYHLLCASRSAC
jgi:hypothetical protein